jgi:negative regulator of sigma E activity
LQDKKTQEMDTRFQTIEDTMKNAFTLFHTDLEALGKDLVELEQTVNERFEKLHL